MNMRALPRRQSGLALVIGLIFLLTLAILSVYAMQRTQLEERMTGNTQDVNLAFQGAEAALRAGESYLASTSSLPSFNGSNGLYQPTDLSSGAQPLWKTIDWTSSTATVAYSGMSGAPDSASRVAARYFIEQAQNVKGPGESLGADTPAEADNFYRVTARGIGAAGTASVVLQSTYKK